MVATGGMEAVDAGQEVARCRSDVKKLLEWQRHQHVKNAARQDISESIQVDAHKPSVDIQDALRSSFEVLLQENGHDHVQAASAESDAFQTVTMVVQLEDFTFSKDEQANVAEVVYRLWPSTSPGVACRSLLEAMLARKSADTAAFTDQLLRILQQTLTVGNKRSLQILLHLYDAVDEGLLEETFPDLVEKLGQCITSQSGAQHAARILSKIALRKHQGDNVKLLNFLKPFIPQESHRAKQAVFEDLLPPVLLQVPELQQTLLEWLQTEAPRSTAHLFALLVLARISPSPDAAAGDMVDRFNDLISTSLTHEDPLIRFEAFRLLSSLPHGASPSRRFDVQHLKLHTMFWKYNLTDSDSPAVRTGLIGEWKHFITRAKLSSNAAHRIVVKYQKRPESDDVNAETEEAQRYLEAVQSFFSDWVTHATAQLSPVKPYRCQISSLIFLQILLEHGIDSTFQASVAAKGGKAKEIISWPFKVQIVTRSFNESLITCMRSTYDDVRNLAYAILVNTPLEADLVQLVYDLGFLLVQRKREADIASATLYLRLASATIATEESRRESRFDVLTGTIPRLLDMLDQRIQAFRLSFAEAADENPVHGILQSLGHLLQVSISVSKGSSITGLDVICRQCVDAIYETWEVTRPILCRGDADVPDDTEEAAEDSTDQIILNASWRAIKEASNLLSVVLGLPTQLRSSLWSKEELSKHASLFPTWLIDITHRGVFAHVSQAYSRLCMTLVKEKASGPLLPETWLKQHLVDILDIERPFARRSAGLPYLLLGAMTCFSPQSEPIQHAFRRLLETSNTTTTATDVTRTHAIHCLRVLLQDGKMGMASKPYIQAAFQVAIPGFGNKHWGVRNASLLLYAALIQRLFSNRKENHLPLARRTSIVDFFSQYNGLVPDLVSALASGIGKTDPESLGSVFSVLLLLSLLATTSASPRAMELVAAFLPLVDACAASSVWKVRKTAAAALTGLIPESHVLEYCKGVLGACTGNVSSNELHGRLMQTHALLSCQGDSSTPLTNRRNVIYWREILELLNRVTHSDQPLPILTQALEIVALNPAELPAAVSTKLHTLASRHYGQRRPGYETYNNALARVLLKVEPARYLSKCLTCQYASAQAATLAFLDSYQPMTAADNACLQCHLVGMVMDAETAIANRVAATQVLSKSQAFKLDQEKFDELVSEWQSSHIPAVKQGILLLLAKHVDANFVSSDMKLLILHDIVEMTTNESAASREAACLAMASISSWPKDRPFQFFYHLAALLQDDDIDVRKSAGCVATKTVAQQQPVCTSRAVELAWQACRSQAKIEDARWLLEGLAQNLQQVTEVAEASTQLLFAVERRNMHLDITLDMRESFSILDEHKSSLPSEIAEASRAVLMSSQDRLHRIVTTGEGALPHTSLAEKHEIENAYVFVQARLLSEYLSALLS